MLKKLTFTVHTQFSKPATIFFTFNTKIFRYISTRTLLEVQYSIVENDRAKQFMFV